MLGAMNEDEQPTHQAHTKDKSFLKFLLPFIGVGVGAILVFGLMILFLNMNDSNSKAKIQQSSSQSSNTDQTAQQPAQEPVVAPKTYDMAYTNSCYSPKDLTIKKGDTVKFTNNAGRNMWPASNDHPSHTIYPEFDAKKAFSKGSTWSFTFDKAGTWGYHDHLKDSCTGTITVQ